jgi:DNA polymerase III epsilon subunit-like protein
MKSLIKCHNCARFNNVYEAPIRVIYRCGACKNEIHPSFRYLVFDTETTGFHSETNPARLVQLAWSIHRYNGSLLAEECYIIKPIGFSIPYDAQRIHGISQDLAMRHGKNLHDVLSRFANSITSETRLIAHNLSYDTRIINYELRAISKTLDGINSYCTMAGSRDLVGARGVNGRLKSPKLEELHRHLFGREFPDAHNALGDVRATSACFFKLRELKAVKY